MKRVLVMGLGLLIAGVIGGSVQAQQAGGWFVVWDIDRDGILTPQEFLGGANTSRTTVEGWDADGNGALNRRELCLGVYSAWNRDKEQPMTVSEWDAGVDNWFGEDAVNLAVADWDDDGNGMITREEFCDEVGTIGLFGRYDLNSDDSMGDIELFSALFEIADTDGDQRLTPEEAAVFARLLG